jgi:hypothetical protein
MANWGAGSAAASNWYAGRDWDRAIALLRETIEAAKGTTDEGRLASTLALMLTALGEPTDEILALLEREARTLSDPSATSNVHYLRGDRALMAGEHEPAARDIERAAEQEGMRAIYLPLAVRPAVWAGDARAVRRLADRLEALPEAEQRPTKANRVVAWAGVAALEGRRADALTGYREGLRRYREISYDFEFARTVIDALHVLGPDEPELRRAAEEAREVFERIGARPYLDLLDQALATPTPEGAAPEGTIGARA